MASTDIFMKIGCWEEIKSHSLKIDTNGDLPLPIKYIHSA